MINMLLGKIAGFFEKDFLFASFLPALIFLSCVAATLAVVIGGDAIWSWVDSWSAVKKATITAICTLVIVVFAYVLHALRSDFVRFWSGNSNFPLYLLWGFFRLGEFFHRWQFCRMRDRVRRSSPWRGVLADFEKKVGEFWSKDREQLPDKKRNKLTKKVNRLHEGLAPDDVEERLEAVVDAYRGYSGEDLKDIYLKVKTTLMDMDIKENVRIKTDTAALDRQFGNLASVKATALGNVIESYNQYSYNRYNIEAEIFWPRLRSVIKSEYLTAVQEPRILLDFSLTMASLGAIYGFWILLAGPWLWFNLQFLIPLEIVGFAVSFLFYRLSISAAYEFGEMVRSSFDLFRLDLMAALDRPHPANFEVERKQWEELSKLAVYPVSQTKINFAIRERES